MNISIILNGVSRKRNTFLRNIYPALQKEFQCHLFITEHAGHAEQLAIAAAGKGHDIILAAGGDGTMSQVINGVVSLRDRAPTVGFIPLGSGNDLARSMNVTADADKVLSLIRKNNPIEIDLGVATLHDEKGKPIQRYFINECSIGMGPEVVRQISDGPKIYGASLTYLKAIVTTFFTHKPERVNVKSEGFEWDGEARVLAVANGKAFGHSIYIAPDAKMDDGKLNMFLCKGLPLAKFLLYLQAIKRPKKIDDPKWINYRLSDFIEIETSEPLPVEADGELIGFTPLKCGVLQKRIKVLA
ncbi:MAG TPA: diacylglycerol kinase family protein [Cyclobacteriaceae bacterium]|nr:diacylglycerol kinase family protein [Cyclobacteriaceae bacterium]